MSSTHPACTCGNDDLRVQATISLIVVSNPSEVTMEIDGTDLDHASVWAWCPDCDASTRDASPVQAVEATMKAVVRGIQGAFVVADLEEWQWKQDR